MAEGVGFEPTVGFHLRWFSRPVHSTALSPFRNQPFERLNSITLAHHLTWSCEKPKLPNARNVTAPDGLGKTYNDPGPKRFESICRMSAFSTCL